MNSSIEEIMSSEASRKPIINLDGSGTNNLAGEPDFQFFAAESARLITLGSPGPMLKK
jgi:hypothetical protein